MNLKIKTKDIDIDFTDQCSALHEDSKKRILEVIESVMTQQLSLEQVRKQQEEIGINFESEEEEPEEWMPKDPKVDDPMWFTKAKQGQMSNDFVEGYSQAVYQMRLYLCSLEREETTVSQTFKYTEYVLKELNKAVASQPYLRNTGTAGEPINCLL